MAATRSLLIQRRDHHHDGQLRATWAVRRHSGRVATSLAEIAPVIHADDARAWWTARAASSFRA